MFLLHVRKISFFDYSISFNLAEMTSKRTSSSPVQKFKVCLYFNFIFSRYLRILFRKKSNHLFVQHHHQHLQQQFQHLMLAQQQYLAIIIIHYLFQMLLPLFYHHHHQHLVQICVLLKQCLNYKAIMIYHYRLHQLQLFDDLINNNNYLSDLVLILFHQVMNTVSLDKFLVNYLHFIRRFTISVEKNSWSL
jgi:hypothetical protein